MNQHLLVYICICTPKVQHLMICLNILFKVWGEGMFFSFVLLYFLTLSPVCVVLLHIKIRDGPSRKTEIRRDGQRVFQKTDTL